MKKNPWLLVGLFLVLHGLCVAQPKVHIGDSSGASSWNEYLARRGAFTPMFLDDTSVTHGKHMEAIREGIEDYEYLRMLRDRVTELEKAGKNGEAIDAAKCLLATAADRVTACMTETTKINWEEPKDRSIADTVRVEVLEALLKLNGDGLGSGPGRDERAP